MTTRKAAKAPKAVQQQAEAQAAARARDHAAPPPPPARQPSFVWGGQPVYECTLGCGDRFQRIGDLAAVEAHERTEHPTNLRATGLLDANGQPVIVRVD